MKRIKFNIFLIFCPWLFIYPINSIATVWPTFTFPSKEFLLSSGVIEQQGNDGGKVHANVAIPLCLFCKTYCPNDWYWRTADKESAVHINALVFQRYEIQYSRDKDGTVLYSRISAFYGKTNAESPMLTLTFTTPASFWSCYEVDSIQHFIICANDI